MHLTRRLLLGSVLSAAASLGGLPLVSAPADAEEITPGGSVVITSTQAPRHLNPAVQSGIATAVPGTQIFASLLKYDDNWQPQPYLAESWETSDDGLSVTVRLVEGATFHDGEPVTSEDVRFSIETVRDNHPFETMFAPVSAVETPDERTAVIRLSQPHPALLLAMSSALLPIIPEHVYGDGQDIQSHPANSAPIGSGPFRLADFEPGRQITLERYDDFFIDGRPYLDRIVIRIVPDPSAMVLALEAGEADILPFLTSSQNIRRLQENEKFAVTDKGYEGIGALNWLAFNTGEPPLDDVRVRQAIAYAVDRDFIVNALHRGVSKAQRGPIIESSPFFNPGIPAYDVDLDKARALLDEAGHPEGADGTRFSLTVDYIPGSGEQQKNIAEYLRSQLPKVGIGIEVRASPDFPTWAQRVSTYDFDLTLDSVFNWGDPVIGVHRTYLSSNIREGVIWSNTQQYANQTVDDILARAALEQDPEKRKALYDEFQMIVAEELPLYPINVIPYHTAYDTRLGNMPDSIWGVIQSMDELYWKEAP
ncbi:ABC transporter substrate-binding protein [Aquibium sp. A9E412]|uniref:ABC transporter substrate-binding protein n=1 Tax=Aquibium sp. A9E412 TaxID=2976767 RepID=UPI0025B200CC|nr:ABC transporter substrate-binding protein [Aquibium sp. A9E412]MDN2565585.1 ABC transporter substrate-binding protein [Aquibium sp. A9E412]